MGMPRDAIVRQVQEVWAWNFHSEFLALHAALQAAGPGATAALDTEFPGALDEDAWRADSRNVRYKAMKTSVDLLSPIQVGLALASADGRLLGAWTFNLRYDLRQELHTDSAVHFLSAAGVDFPRHAAQGIDRRAFGSMLTRSPLVGAASPTWLTFSGLHDLGYLLKLLSTDPLPDDVSVFDEALAKFCPRNLELRDWLPHGSLEQLAKSHVISREGRAHTAGSDALVTLKLFLRVGPLQAVSSPGEQSVMDPPASSAGLSSGDSSADDRLGLPVAETSFNGFDQVTRPFCPPRRLCPSSGWGAAARWAMQTANQSAHGCNKSAKAVPSSLWGAAAREALGATRTPSWGLAARHALEENKGIGQYVLVD